MKVKSQIIGLFVGLTLLGSGCLSLRPPVEDRADLLQQQK
jgi:hypothetical protein